MNEEDDIQFGEDLWIRVDEDLITLGVKEETLEDISEIWNVDLPDEGSEVSPDQVCGEVETSDGPVNLYTPVEGEVTEVNTTMNTDPSLLLDDSTSEGWLIKIRAADPDDLQKFLEENSNEEGED